jgi:demethylsterigmatocystin 6-O-methyltransferase
VTQALPDFLKETKYQNIVSNTKTAFNLAWKTTLPNFVWLRERPLFWDYLHKALQVQHSSDWLSGFNVENYLGDWSAQPDDGKVLFVDVGGSMGIQCAGFKRKYPHLTGTVLLQDMKETVENPQIVKPIEGVEIMAQDFFKPQAVKGIYAFFVFWSSLDTGTKNPFKEPSFTTTVISFMITQMRDAFFSLRAFSLHLERNL